ncbi:phage tail assembly chaperone G [Paraclostridium bifermentans]|uniref:phage tail assembly chaperone G n=1 Tax=Paraclostridium bifermentans TaxID=1490 RepID=UPI001C7EA84C|nr:hypothetical protein [Paraclostridium bifermentans]GIM32967.1 hypothetical protein PAGU1678_22370 [Paraclostridium bifermentans subsp. muricolitidis]
MKIVVKNKEYDSGKLGRKKYKEYSEVREDLSDEGKSYTDADLDRMVKVIVTLFDNQFTEDDINEDFEVSDIIYNFLRFDIEIGEKLTEKLDKTNNLFMIGKK